MQTKSYVHQIECTAHGPVQIRFALVVEADNGAEISRNWHRTVIVPDVDNVSVLDAVNADFARMGFPQIDQFSEDWKRVQSVCATAWTKPIMDKYNAIKDATIAENLRIAQEAEAAQAEAKK